MKSMPATAQMTAWPKETAVRTTRRSAKVGRLHSSLITLCIMYTVLYILLNFISYNTRLFSSGAQTGPRLF